MTEMVEKCAVYNELSPNQQKEPMMSHPVPKYPYQIVSLDCFELDRRRHYVMVAPSVTLLKWLS